MKNIFISISVGIQHLIKFRPAQLLINVTFFWRLLKTHEYTTSTTGEHIFTPLGVYLQVKSVPLAHSHGPQQGWLMKTFVLNAFAFVRLAPVRQFPVLPWMPPVLPLNHDPCWDLIRYWNYQGCCHQTCSPMNPGSRIPSKLFPIIKLQMRKIAWTKKLNSKGTRLYCSTQKFILLDEAGYNLAKTRRGQKCYWPQSHYRCSWPKLVCAPPTIFRAIPSTIFIIS